MSGCGAAESALNITLSLETCVNLFERLIEVERGGLGGGGFSFAYRHFIISEENQCWPEGSQTQCL